MREAVAARTVDWLSGVVDLMREPRSTMPVRAVIERLSQTFRHTAISWNWFESDGSFGMVMEPADALSSERDTLELWMSGEVMDCHALSAWYLISNDPTPLTLARVPTGVVPRRRRLVVERPLRRLGMEHQLSIVYRSSGPVQYAFVAARGGRDFDDDDLLVATWVQRSLHSLDRQCAALERMVSGAGSPTVGADLGLSGRELAVLQLVAEGHPTRLIGRRLGCAPRTIEKHLERAFRKLGVRDRLNAVRVARLTGIVGPRAPRTSVDPLGPGEFRGPVRPARAQAERLTTASVHPNR